MKYDIEMFQKLVQILQYKGTPIGKPMGYPIGGTPCFKVTHITFFTVNRFLFVIGISPPPSVLNGQYQAGWNTNQN